MDNIERVLNSEENLPLDTTLQSCMKHLPMAVAKYTWLSFDIFIKDILMAMEF
jgi:hypothetical protein